MPFEDYEDDQQAEETEELGNYEDDLGGFIVDDDEIDGNGQVVRCDSLCFYHSPTSSMSLALCKITYYCVHSK